MNATDANLQGVAHDADDKELVERLLTAIRGIRYGAVEIIIHNSKVVQIERKEKYRLEGRDTDVRK